MLHYFTKRNAANLLLLCALSGCSRASYVFQTPAATAAPIAVVVAPPTLLPLVVERPSTLILWRPTRHYRSHKIIARTSWSLPYPGSRLTAAVARRPQLAQRHAEQPSSLGPVLVDQPLHSHSRGVALLLALALGCFGAHLFYLGYEGRGTAYLISLLVGFTFFIGGALASLGGGISPLIIVGAVLAEVPVALSLVDAVRIIINSLLPKQGDYYPGFFQRRASAGFPDN